MGVRETILVAFGVCMCNFIVHHSLAAEYTVGGNVGWALTSLNYSQWAQQNTYRVGDTLKFVYSQGDHTVNEVSQADYDSCSSLKPLQLYTGGNTVVTLLSQRKYWFLCGVVGHCEAGMKFGITVLGGPSAAPLPLKPPPVPLPPRKFPPLKSPPAPAISPVASKAPPPSTSSPASPPPPPPVSSPGASPPPAPAIPPVASKAPAPLISSPQSPPPPASSPEGSPPPISPPPPQGSGSAPAKPWDVLLLLFMLAMAFHFLLHNALMS